MNVYIVTSGEYSDYKIEGVFSSTGLADAFANGCDEYMVDIWTLDARQGETVQMIYEVRIECATGEFDERYTMSPAPEVHQGRYTEVTEFGSGIDARSSVSEEHARKLAVEARQKWLRKKA